MRSSLLLTALTTLVLPLAAHAGSIFPRSSIIDVCASIHLDLFAALDLPSTLLSDLGLSNPSVSGDLDVCLCLGALPLFLETNVVAIAAVNNLGPGGDAIVTALLTAIIDLAAAGKPKCQYPPHAVQLCTDADPCGFTCSAGYVLSGNTCVPAPAPSSGTRRRNHNTLPARLASRGVPSCAKPGEQVCGTANGEGEGWECVDVKADLYSCGACPHPPSALLLSLYPSPSTTTNTPFLPGTDCTSLAHVEDVACVAGGCVIAKCEKGWEPAANAGECVLVGAGVVGVVA